MPLQMSIARRLDGDALLRVLRRVERFEDGWKRGAPEPLEHLLPEATGAERDELLRQALGVELDYRRRRGEQPINGEYLTRFPDAVEVVRGAFEEPTMSMTSGTTVDMTSLHRVEPLPETIGKFLVVGRLGSGGQGSAYLARDPDLGHLVVLKRYHASAGDPNAEGAIRDGKALVRLRSRFTPQCHGLEHVGNELILVMEYIPGRNLSEVIASGPPSPGAAARWIEQVAEGLEAVHACGLVHRDIKPSNIVMGDDGVPRLVDFGLAAHLGSVALEGVSGSPPYMAPEQARGQWERIDGRTDVYGLGAVLYALLTGQPPHPGATPQQALEHARQGDVRPPREWKRSIPRPLEEIVLRALAADPAQRYSTAAGLRLALQSYRHRNVRALSIILAIVLALAMLVWGLRSRRDHTESTTQVPTTHSPAPAALTGELTVRVWTPGGKGKRGWSVEDPRTLPVLPGEQVHLEARLNQPAYAYLLWLDSQGQVVSLYPWSNQHFGPRPTVEAEQESIQSPLAIDEGWPMRGPGGLETAVLLVRSSPLPVSTDLAALIDSLPPVPLGDPQEVAVCGCDPGQSVEAINRGEHRLRGLGTDPERIDDSLLQLMRRLRPHFEVIRVVRFAYEGESVQAR
jgi:serine/threonine protein kinase